MKPKDLIKKLEQDDWTIDRISGSHYIMKKGDKTEVIPMHNKDMKPGILNAILKRTGMK